MCTLCFGVTINSTCHYVLKNLLVKGVLGIAKVQMSFDTLGGCVVSAAFAAGISLESILQAGDWASVSTPSRHYYSTFITTTDWHQDSSQFTVLGLSE